jgi:putative DNA primase/helicase
VMKLADTLGWPVMEPVRHVEARAVRWLWPGRVPIGKPIVIYGGCDPGKSLVALNLAAWVSAGADWPDGRGKAPCGNVILMCRQDNLADTVRPRLDRAGAVVERIIALNRVSRVIGDKVVRRNITLGDLQDLERAIEIAGNVQLVVIDPLSAYFGAGMPSARRIGPVIDALTDLAERYGLAVVITAEFGGRDGLGSGATMTLTSAVRMAWMLAPVPGPVDAPVPSLVEVAEPPDPPGTRMLLVPVKSSLGDPGGGLALRIGDHAVEWEPAPIAISNGAAMLGQAGPGLALPEAGVGDLSLIAPPRKSGPKPQCRQSASQWLQEQLAAGPMPVGKLASADGTLRAAASSAGMAWTTVRRAFAELGGVREKCPATGKQMWRLPTTP